MTDNVAIAPATGGGTVPCATDDVGGVQFQRTKVTWGVDGTAVDASASNPLPVTDGPADTSTVTQVTSSASNTTLKVANANRRGLYIYNDSSSILYVKLGATASLTSYSTQVPAGGLYELPARPGWTGIVDGFWAAANGSAMVTELTGRV